MGADWVTAAFFTRLLSITSYLIFSWYENKSKVISCQVSPTLFNEPFDVSTDKKEVLACDAI